jgi:hypothetical protein
MRHECAYRRRQLLDVLAVFMRTTRLTIIQYIFPLPAFYATEECLAMFSYPYLRCLHWRY